MATIQKRKNESGKTSYRVMVRLKGYPTASATFERLTDAREWGARTQSEMKAGRYFGAAKQKSLADLIGKYAQARKASLKSWSDVERRLDWWRSKAGDQMLDTITAARIAELRDELLATPKQHGGGRRSGADVNRTLAALSAAM